MIYQEITGEVIGCVMEVHKILGCGFLGPIQSALEIEFKNGKIKNNPEFEIKIFCKGENIALSISRVDFLIAEVIIVEMKAKAELNDIYLAQAINYLESSSYPIGLLINFGAKSLQFNRLYNKRSANNQIQSNES